MTRLEALNPETTLGRTKELFNAVESKLGVVPNMMRTMGNSAAVLDGYLSLSGALGKGSLGAKIGELIALTVAQANSCEYCLAAHTYIGDKLVKIDENSISQARTGRNDDPKIEAILSFAQTLVSKQGLVTAEDVNAVKQAGLNDGEIGEVIAHVALNIFTNYFNNTALTQNDFPTVVAV